MRRSARVATDKPSGWENRHGSKIDERGENGSRHAGSGSLVCGLRAIPRERPSGVRPVGEGERGDDKGNVRSFLRDGALLARALQGGSCRLRDFSEGATAKARPSTASAASPNGRRRSTSSTRASSPASLPRRRAWASPLRRKPRGTRRKKCEETAAATRSRLEPRRPVPLLAREHAVAIDGDAGAVAHGLIEVRVSLSESASGASMPEAGAVQPSRS